MIKKFTAYLLIIFLIIPPTFFIKPTRSDAFIIQAIYYGAVTAAPFIARKVITMAARAGFGRYRNMTQLVLPLKPQRGKLYNLVFNKWSGAFGSAVASEAAIFAFGSYNDKPLPTCVTWEYPSFKYGSGIWEGATPLQIVTNIDLYLSNYGAKYTLVAQPYPNGEVVDRGIFVNSFTTFDVPAQYWNGGILNGQKTLINFQDSSYIKCKTSLTQVKSAYDQLYDDYQIDPVAQEPVFDNLLKGAKNEATNNNLNTFDGSQGVQLEEVNSLTFTDKNGVQHTYTIDPATSQVLLDGQPIGDSATIVDSSGIEHNYTIDPVTGNILDNGQPVGNFATWTDADGVQHTITQDPVTGRLMVDGVAWNPPPNTPTASNPSGGTTPTSGGGTTVTTDPYTGQTTVTTNIDLQPLIDVQATAITEQKKTTDALLKTNSNLKDLYSTTEKGFNDLTALSKAQESTLKDIYSAVAKQNNVNTSGAKETRPMNLQGIQTTAQNIINSSSIATWGDAMRVAGPSGLPIFTIPTMFGDVAFDTSTYKFAFDAVGILTLIAASYMSILIIFKSK